MTKTPYEIMRGWAKCNNPQQRLAAARSLQAPPDVLMYLVQPNQPDNIRSAVLGNPTATLDVWMSVSATDLVRLHRVSHGQLPAERLREIFALLEPLNKDHYHVLIELAFHPNLPHDVMQALFDRSPIGGMWEHGLIQNPSTPLEILAQIQARQTWGMNAQLLAKRLAEIDVIDLLG